VGRILFVLGGARSGKSRYAQFRASEAAGPGRPVAFIATAEARDEEMRQRIRLHRQDRPSGWVTREAPRKAGEALRAVGPEAGAVLVDCLTLLVSNLLLDEPDEGKAEQAVLEEMGRLLAAARSAPVPVILVSNEVGQGVVPASRLGRAFRDIAGRAHQLVAAEADEVVFLTAGLPQRLK
jgi:adenosylcobinamide kinase/adenosylcobinamide-phosphate guanylyltransferase